LQGRQFWLTAERCLFWESRKTLIVSDLHFGKTGHFRKAGIPIPATIYKEDLQRLWQQVQYFQPEEIIFVGDLFHSYSNQEHDWFMKWRSDFPNLTMHLVMGNHDIRAKEQFEAMNLIVHEDCLKIDEFCFVHDFEHEMEDDNIYYISGHIHPGIRIIGNGRQSLCFPCFYFTPQYAILPAFSRFTGLAMIVPKRDENVYAIVENSLIMVGH
jgi:DNA ligase-associated metallophosphoesterase